jgi:hypothetical protein
VGSGEIRVQGGQKGQEVEGKRTEKQANCVIIRSVILKLEIH